MSTRMLKMEKKWKVKSCWRLEQKNFSWRTKKIKLLLRFGSASSSASSSFFLSSPKKNCAFVHNFLGKLYKKKSLRTNINFYVKVSKHHISLEERFLFSIDKQKSKKSFTFTFFSENKKSKLCLKKFFCIPSIIINFLCDVDEKKALEEIEK